MRTTLKLASLLMCAPALLGLAGAGVPAGSTPIAEPAVMQSGALSASQIDRLTWPIALYQDAQISALLPAATTPVQIVLAERWMEAHPQATADEINEQEWPQAVKSLAAYPRILQMMSEKLAWTQGLGLAYAQQPEDVMGSIERLRAEARAGQLSPEPATSFEPLSSDFTAPAVPQYTPPAVNAPSYYPPDNSSVYTPPEYYPPEIYPPEVYPYNSYDYGYPAYGYPLIIGGGRIDHHFDNRVEPRRSSVGVGGRIGLSAPHVSFSAPAIRGSFGGGGHVSGGVGRSFSGGGHGGRR